MNAETLVITKNSKGEDQPIGTKVSLAPHELLSLTNRKIVKELKPDKAETKELKTVVETK